MLELTHVYPVPEVLNGMVQRTQSEAHHRDQVLGQFVEGGAPGLPVVGDSDRTRLSPHPVLVNPLDGCGPSTDSFRVPGPCGSQVFPPKESTSPTLSTFGTRDPLEPRGLGVSVEVLLFHEERPVFV